MAIAQSDSVIVPVINGGNGTLEDEFINGLVQGGSWTFSGPRQISYSFNLNDDGSYPEGPIVQGPGGSWSSYPQIATAVTQALTAWSNVANVSFQEVTSGTYYFQSTADLSFTLTGDDLQNYFGAVGLSFFPDPDFVNATLAESGYNSSQFPNMEGNVFLDNYGPSPLATSVAAGTAGFWVVLHEIGHALGLKHTFDDGANLKPTFSELGISAYDAMQYTVMSYTTGFTYAATPMPLDILAIQTIYGANTAYNTGNNTYTLNNGYYGTIWDAGGSDVIDATSWPGTEGVLIDLTAGAYSGVRTGEKTTAIAYNVTIENAIGSSGHDALLGNAAVNSLAGAGGSDTLDGGMGSDMLGGGPGDDFFLVDHAADLILEGEGEGIDHVQSSVSMVLAANVEKLTLTGAAVSGTGNALDNVLTGNAAANRLDGGTGFDHMSGGDGNDTYFVDTGVPDYALVMSGEPGEWISGGESHLYTSATGTFMVSSLWDNTGDGLVDFVRIYYTDASHSWMTEFGSSGTGANLDEGEYLDARRATSFVSGHPGLDVYGDGRGSNELYGSFTVHEIEVDYSGGGPVLVSFSASFELHSDGPTAPELTGTINYNVSSTMIETVTENPDEGVDTIISSVSALLPDHVETLVLTGSGDFVAAGNGTANILSGNAGNNLLDGAAGADIIAGGPGNDTYVVDNSGDQVMELGNSGLDAVQSGVSYDLMQAWHVENLTLTGGGAVNGSGNWLDNVITGNSAANRLEGNRSNDTINGGGGSDTLIGGLGDDVLVWDAADAGVQGGAGSDTLLIDGSGVTLDLTAIADTLITDVEVIDLTGSGNNTLTLGLSDVIAISSTTDRLRIEGDAGDVVNAGGSWSAGGSETIGSQSYDIYTQGTATLLVDVDATLVLA